MDQCELTYLSRTAINPTVAAEQHDVYCRTLESLGVEVIRLRGNESFPDCAFVEDTAIVLDDVAIIGSMGAESRRGEPNLVAETLSKFRPLTRVEPPATLEGGDVLVAGRTLLVGCSPRTNAAGVAALRAEAEPRGWEVREVAVKGCLHLKTACTMIADNTLLVRSDWIDSTQLKGFEVLEAPAEEPWAPNVMRIGDVLCLPSSHSVTAKWLVQRGHAVRSVRISEFAKAEAGMTCLSLLFD